LLDNETASYENVLLLFLQQRYHVWTDFNNSWLLNIFWDKPQN